MRTALAIATAAATSLIGLGTAAPASATACEAHYSGWTINDLQLHHGVTCDHAKQVVHHAMRREAYKIDWSCNEPSSTSHKFFSCWSNKNSHRVTFYASENGASGGF
jgi:hypothetical protein